MKLNDNEIPVYVGTYTDQSLPGIYVYAFHTEAGSLRLIDQYAEIGNPSYLTIDPSRMRLYVVSEEGEGAIVSYAITPETGSLKLLNTQLTLGAHPCYLSLDPGGNSLFVANYSGGNVGLFPVADEGIGPIAENIQHVGSSIQLDRQEAAHPHSIMADPAGSYVFVPDLGMDRIVVYQYERESQKLVNHASVEMKPGSGPRHLVFHPSLTNAYVINELDSTITAFSYDPELGALTQIQSLSTLQESFTGVSYCADIHISPNGKFLYGSNRGEDSIVLFHINETDGTLTYVDHISTFGNFPRNFAIMPGGKFLLAANQNSDTIVTYSIDEMTGRLTLLDDVVAVVKPVCIKAFG